MAPRKPPEARQRAVCASLVDGVTPEAEEAIWQSFSSGKFG